MEAWKANTDDKGHLNEGLGTWILEYVLAGRERREDGSRTGTGREPNTPMPGRDRPLSHKPAWGRGSYGRHREANSGQRGRPWGWGRRRGRACACAGPGRRAADLLGACLDIVTLERGEALGAGRASSPAPGPQGSPGSVCTQGPASACITVHSSGDSSLTQKKPGEPRTEARSWMIPTETGWLGRGPGLRGVCATNTLPESPSRHGQGPGS